MILVTGGSGFIGGHTARALVEAGVDVVATQFRTRADAPPARTKSYARFVREPLDITDFDALCALVERRHVQGILHLAAPKIGLLSLAGDARADLIGLLNVLECARRYELQRVTLASGIAVYAGVGARPFRESAALPAASAGTIAALKKSAEILGLAFAERTGLDVVIARIALVYGPLYRSLMNAPGRLAHRAIRWPADSGVNVPAQEYADYCYVDDCADALLRLQTAPALQERIYNVGSGRGTTHRGIADAVHAAIPAAPLPDAAARAEDATADAYLDLTQIERDTGYRPRYDIGTGIAAYVDWLREHPY